MSDLIISINFDESKKKNKIVLETYEGTIPKLKSKKYSGQLRNVNINAEHQYDNIRSSDLKMIKNFFNKKSNVQISKYQYLIFSENLFEIKPIIVLECLFYKDKSKGMYQVTQIFFDINENKLLYEIEGLKFGANKTEIFFVIDHKKQSQKLVDIQPKAYIDLNSKNYPLELVFDYDNFSIGFTSKERYLIENSTFRDFGFEENVIEYINFCGWEYKRVEGFRYSGKDIGQDISKLWSKGISVYTSTEKPVVYSDFSNVQISYDVDWFSIKGEVGLNDEVVDVSNLLNLKKKHQNWVEYNGKIVFLPSALNSKAILIDKVNKKNIIDKRCIVDAIDLAYEINGSCIENIDNFIEFDKVNYDIDTNIDNLLRQYQRIGVQWLISLQKNGFGGCLADDMGLGKTLQVIAFLSQKCMCNSFNLIIVPKTLLVNWQREIKRFSPITSLYVYHGSERDKTVIGNYKVIISTYRTLVNDIDLFKDYRFTNLIIDEAQYIKNSKSKAYRALKSINAAMKIILTGTPLENNIEEFLGLMRLINPSIMNSCKDTILYEKNALERVRMITSPFVLRRLKKDVLKDLPDKQEQVLYVKMEIEQQKLYDRMLDSIRYEILRKNEKFEIKSNAIMLSGLLYLQEICCHPKLLNKEYNEEGCVKSAKLDLLMDLLKTLYSSDHKVVVFSRFTKMLKIIEKKLVCEHMNYFYLDGKTKNRMTIIDEFEYSKQGVFLISLKAGGTGINLTSADTAILYDPWWNPASEKQAEDRIYRIGQKKNVMIYRLIVEGTIEEKIQKLQYEKTELFSEILDDHDMPMPITIEILEQLIIN